MRQFIVALLIGCLAIQAIHAQKLELNIGTGYHFSAGSQYFLDKMSFVDNNSSYRKVDASLGRGMAAHIALTTPLNNWLGIGLGLEYDYTVPSVKGSTILNGIDYSYSEHNDWRSKTLMVSPSFRLNISGQKLNPYARFGALVPVYSRIHVHGDYESFGLGGPLNKGATKKVYRLKNTVGYTASAGVAPKIGKHTSFFAEISLAAQAIQAKRSTVTSDIVNGVEKIDTYSTYSRETIYVKNLDNLTYNPDEPSRQQAFSLPYSYIGLNIGLRFIL